MSADIFQRIKKGLVPFSDPDYYKILEACQTTRELMIEMNRASKLDDVRSLLSEITDSAIDDSVTIFTPFHINYGKNTTFGKNIFINFDCTFLDLGGIEINDNVMLGPGVKLLTESHPTDPNNRQTLTTAAIFIKQNAWIGANAIILPGVTIGEHSVVAAGAVVSKDVPDHSVVAGVPAKIIKSI